MLMPTISPFNDVALCVISFAANFLAEATLRTLRPPIDTYVIHTGKDSNLIKSFATLPSFKHIVFNTPRPDHATTLNQICFDNSRFAKIFDKYKWIMFLDHDIIIKHPNLFWSILKDKLRKDPDYCIYSTYDFFTTNPFFIIQHKRLSQIVKNKRYDPMRHVGFTPLDQITIPIKMDYGLAFNQIKRYDSWFDTGRTISRLCESVYNIPRFRTNCQVIDEALADMLHVSSFWNNKVYEASYIKDDNFERVCQYKRCVESIVENIKNKTFQFYSQSDIDKFLSYAGINFHFQRSPFNLQVEDLPQGFSFVASPIKIDYVGSES